MNLSGSFQLYFRTISAQQRERSNARRTSGIRCISDIIIGKSDVLFPSITRQIATCGTEAAIDRLFEVYFTSFVPFWHNMPECATSVPSPNVINGYIINSYSSHAIGHNFRFSDPALARAQDSPLLLAALFSAVFKDIVGEFVQAGQKVCHTNSFGARITALPSCRITTSSVLKRNLSGSSTAWPLPLSKPSQYPSAIPPVISICHTAYRVCPN